MIEDIILGIPLGILLCLMIGPVFFVLLETAAIKGIRASLVFDAGVVGGVIFFTGLTYAATVYIY
jgi:threonine/homoserine/homoserine lactone efflux protein